MVRFVRTPESREWDITKVEGDAGEQRVVDALNRLVTGVNYEVKSDQKARKTGNLAIETLSLTGASPRPSGLSTSRADTWFLEVFPGFGFWVETGLLLSAVQAESAGKRPIRFVNSRPPTAGHVIPAVSLFRRVLALGMQRVDR